MKKDLPVKKELAIRPHGFSSREPFLYSGLQSSSTSEEPMFCAVERVETSEKSVGGRFQVPVCYLSLQLINAATLIVPPMILEVISHLIVQINWPINVLIDVKN